jgi:ABC-type phosphate transport system ATPase subunit
MKCVVTSDLNRKEREDYMSDKQDEAVATLAAEIKSDLIKGVYVDGAIDWRAADICDEISLDVDQVELRDALGVIWRFNESINVSVMDHGKAFATIARHLDAAADKLCEQLARKKLAEADRP